MRLTLRDLFWLMLTVAIVLSQLETIKRLKDERDTAQRHADYYRSEYDYIFKILFDVRSKP